MVFPYSAIDKSKSDANCLPLVLPAGNDMTLFRTKKLIPDPEFMTRWPFSRGCFQ